jgi:cation diffusion facilitator CzcD-associated flavoprotein CzcO
VPQANAQFYFRPAYEGLKNNIPISLQELKGHPWKEGLEDFVNIKIIGDYLHSYSEKFGIEPEIKFNTRVEKLDKLTGEKKWRVKTSTLIKDGPSSGQKIRQTDVSLLTLREYISDLQQDFDAVVVANGHYHACKVPDIPGLKEWKITWPSRVQHSKTYRVPTDFKDQVYYPLHLKSRAPC